MVENALIYKRYEKKNILKHWSFLQTDTTSKGISIDLPIIAYSKLNNI